MFWKEFRNKKKTRPNRHVREKTIWGNRKLTNVEKFSRITERTINDCDRPLARSSIFSFAKQAGHNGVRDNEKKNGGLGGRGARKGIIEAWKLPLEECWPRVDLRACTRHPTFLQLLFFFHVYFSSRPRITGRKFHPLPKLARGRRPPHSLLHPAAGLILIGDARRQSRRTLSIADHESR